VRGPCLWWALVKDGCDSSLPQACPHRNLAVQNAKHTAAHTHTHTSITHIAATTHARQSLLNNIKVHTPPSALCEITSRPRYVGVERDHHPWALSETIDDTHGDTRHTLVVQLDGLPVKIGHIQCDQQDWWGMRHSGSAHRPTPHACRCHPRVLADVITYDLRGEVPLQALRRPKLHRWPLPFQEHSRPRWPRLFGSPGTSSARNPHPLSRCCPWLSRRCCRGK